MSAGIELKLNRIGERWRQKIYASFENLDREIEINDARMMRVEWEVRRHNVIETIGLIIVMPFINFRRLRCNEPIENILLA